MNTGTILGSVPSHPLDEVLQALFSERFDLITGKASEWMESKVSMWCWVASRLRDAIKNENDVAALDAMAKQIGMWAIEAFKKKDANALRRLAECWDSGGYEGVPSISGGTTKRGRKDLLKSRNVVMTQLMEEAKKSGAKFSDSTVRYYAWFYCGISKLSDETVKKWRESVGKEGLQYHLPSKRGPRKGTKQEFRASACSSAKSSNKKRRKTDK
jgi:hypothetical protein